MEQENENKCWLNLFLDNDAGVIIIGSVKKSRKEAVEGSAEEYKDLPSLAVPVSQNDTVKPERILNWLVRYGTTREEAEIILKVLVNGIKEKFNPGI